MGPTHCSMGSTTMSKEAWEYVAFYDGAAAIDMAMSAGLIEGKPRKVKPYKEPSCCNGQCMCHEGFGGAHPNRKCKDVYSVQE